MGYNDKAYNALRPGVKAALKQIELLVTKDLTKVTPDERDAVLFHFEQLRRGESKARAEKARTEFNIKVSDKGAISVYGTGRRFPTSLYPEEWAAILSKAAEITKFIEENKDLIAHNRK